MDKQKADGIITEYLPKTYGFAIKKSFSYGEAEDLCSDIIAELYHSLLKTNEIYNIDGYIWRINEHVYSKYV
jgi:DNA-directed RNA polymerase specialized sigma24 family protein